MSVLPAQSWRLSDHHRLVLPAWHLIRITLLGMLGALLLACGDAPTAPATPGTVALLIVGGDHQAGAPGAELPLPLTVQATNAEGAALAGVVVNFRVTSGGGTVFAGAALTNRQGRASDYWTLGTDTTLPQQLEVRAVTAAGRKEVLAQFTATFGGGALARGVLSAGAYQTCALTADGRAWCWGHNGGGELGDGTYLDRSVPTTVGGGLVFASISGGYWHSCGLATDSLGYCWGFNAFGDLGDGTNVGRVLPSPVAGGHHFTLLDSGTWTGCALEADGSAWCWGNNDYGRVGDGTTQHRNTPVAVIGGLHFSSIVAGANQTCGLIAGGIAYCWGQNNVGQLGDGTNLDRYQPTVVAGGHQFTTLALGYGHTCGLAPDGAMYCWGDNGFGQLGDGTTSNRNVPTAVAGGHRFTAFAAGGFHTCGVEVGGAARCWGRNSRDPVYGGGGQLGDGTQTDRHLPTPVLGGLSLVLITAGESHTCAIAADDHAWCWGNNASGQLGDGSTTNRVVPVAVTGGLAFPPLPATTAPFR